MKGKMQGPKRFLHEEFVVSTLSLRVVSDSQIHRHDKYLLARLCFFWMVWSRAVCLHLDS